MKPCNIIEEQGVKYALTSTLIAAIIGDKQARKIDHIPFNRLCVLSIAELKAEGLTTRAAAAIKAAIELKNRKEDTAKQVITSSRAAYETLQFLEDEQTEHFYCLCMNKANRIIKVVKISEGGIDGTVADIGIIAKECILLNAKACILAHNHPSGRAYPSDSDRKLTAQIKEGLKTLQIQVLDHVIIAGTGSGTPSGYYSFADEGIL